MTSNRFLGTLSPTERPRVAGYLKRVSLEVGEHLYNMGGRIRYVYFPEGALLSMFISTDNKHSLETVMVGREGASGIPAVLGNGISSHEVIVQHPGPAWRLEAPAFCDVFLAGGAFQRYALRYNQFMFLMATQAAFCGATHGLEERLARWLLTCQDGAGTDTLHLTHDLLSAMLGVQRTSVTTAALALREAGAIRYSRGRIDIVDRAKLVGTACRCYATLWEQKADLLAPDDQY